MKIDIINYSKEYDKLLLELFYRSVYGIPTYKEEKGSDYVRVPSNWNYRYSLSEGSITKIAIENDKIIGSLGIVIRTGKINGKKVKIGCFVDNCISPKYLNNYDDIIQKLFISMETEAKEKGVDVICGWDFYKLPIGEHRKLFERMNYKWIEDVSWYLAGDILNGEYPYIWNSMDINIFWRLVFRLLRYKYKLRGIFIPKLTEDISIRDMKTDDLEGVCDLINTNSKDTLFATDYNKKDFQDIIKRNNIHGLVAVKNSRIIGVLTYITVAWSGQMFGKPYYDKNWKIVFGFLPDEFAVLSEYRKTELPTNMVIELAKIKNPKKGTRYKSNHAFISDVIEGHRDMEWRRNAFLNFGCMKPKAGYGVILAKSLRNDIEIDTSKIWHLPARNIVAPVPEKIKMEDKPKLFK
jgi:hypothetical protein